ncbi:MAG: hypothetical protein ABR613_06595 [Actinomycetota bacterium]
MKRFRLFVVGAVAVAALGVGAAPASACQPDSPCPPCDTPVDPVWQKLTGRPLLACTY